MTDFANGILSSIRNDQEFKYNPIIMAVVENLENKRPTYRTDSDFLTAVKEGLSGVNAYVKNPRIEAMLVKIDEQLGSESNTNMHVKVDRMYYEVDMPGAVKALRESTAYTEPVIMNYVNAAINELETKKVPYFRYIPGFIATMNIYRNNEVVNEWVTKFEKYLNENRKRLMMLEAVHYLDGIGNGFYHGVTEKLKPFIISNEFNSNKIMLEMKEFTNIPVVKDMITAMQVEESNTEKQFNLGVGDGNTKIFSYIGPVLKEDNNLVLFADGRFINITGKPVDEKNVESVLGTSGDMTVQELKPEYVYESMSNYYQIAKSFEFLNFNLGDRKVSTKLRNIKVDFKLNESGDLDLYLNEERIEDPKQVNFHQMFVLESNYVKNCSSLLLNNVDKVYNVEFVKLMVNEAKNAASIVMNVNEDYYVYDFLEGNRRNIFKTDGFNLQKFVFEKFGYDVRELFSIEIDDVKNKVLSIDGRKREITDALAKLEESYKLLTTTIEKPGVKSDDIETVKELREKVEKQMHTLNNAFILLEDERSTLLGNKPQAQTSANYKLGDNVNIGDKTGRIVALPSDDKDQSYMVYTTEGRTEKVNKTDMQLSDTGDFNVNKTNEAKSQEETPKTQDDAQKTEEEAQKSQDEAQKTQEETQKTEEKAQKSQDDAQKTEEEAQKTQTQTTQPEQGIVQPQGTPQTVVNGIEGFEKINGELTDLRSAVDTVRPEVRDKFNDLGNDLETLIKQSGELKKLSDEISNIKSVSDKVDLSKAEKKFDKIKTELESVTAELTAEFGKGAQQVVVSESLIASAYDKYLGVVTGVADKLTLKVSNIVKKLSGELIDLDADIKVINARAYAAKAKDELAGTNTVKDEVPVAGSTPQAQVQLDMSNAAQVQANAAVQAQEDKAQAQTQEQVQAQADAAVQAQAQTQEQVQAQAQEDTDKKVNESATFYSRENLNEMTDENLAKEYSDIFGISEDDALDGITNQRSTYIDEILHEYDVINKNKV